MAISCGIPSAPYLPPVPSLSVESPIGPETDYYFLIPDPSTINPEVFEGFEIYYKLFDPFDNIDDKLNTSGDTSLSSPVSLTSLKNAGYQRIAASTETAPSLPAYPLIPLSETDKQNAALIIQLEFSNIGNEIPKSVHGAVNFSRTLKNKSGNRELKGFQPSNFEAEDSDLPADFDPESNFDITVALYVMSYGNDYENLTFNIHSTAVYLGSSDLILTQ